MGKPIDRVSAGPPPHSHRLSKLPCLLCTVSSGSWGPWPGLGTAGRAVLSCHSTMCFRMLASTHTHEPHRAVSSPPHPTGLAWLSVLPKDGVSPATSRTRFPTCWLPTEHLGVAPPCSQRTQGDNHLRRKQTHVLKGRAPNQTSGVGQVPEQSFEGCTAVSQEHTRKGVPGSRATTHRRPEVRECRGPGDREEALGAEQEQSRSR